jgi:tetratricopeptide (TPR) repeat protein
LAWGHVELLQNKVSDAKNRFETAISLSKGKDIDVLNAIGKANVDSKTGDVNYAIEKLTAAQALDKKRKNVDIYVNLGDAYRKVPDGAKAQQAYENALMIQPNNAEASFMIGRLYQTQGVSQEPVYMRYFNDAIAKDASYAPVYAWLSEYYYKRDINKAKEYLDKYISVADQDSKNCYYQASYLYASGKFQDAVTKSDECIKAGGEDPYPSLYGIKAYAYDKLGDSINAKSFFDTYFQKQNPDKIGPSDYAAYAKVLLKIPGNEELAGQYVDKAITMDTVDANKLEYVTSIANGFIDAQNYNEAAKWYTRLLNVKKDYGKVDLYYAGYNFYRGGNYASSDSIFKLYQAKYPTDIFGWFMGARSKEGIDTSGAEGLALPDYQQVLAIADTAVDKEKVKDNQIRAYKYILAYNYNIKKDVEAAKAANEKILELDPADEQALSNKDAFNKASAKKSNTTSTKTTTTTKKPPVKKP